MDENAGKGGSYTRQPDGSLKLVSRTETAKPAEPDAKASKKPDAKKENADG